MRHVNQAQLIVTDQVVEAPGQHACNDQSFELPTGLYLAMQSMFAGFVAVLALAFHGQMAATYGVIFAFLAMFFAVRPLFPRLAGENRARALKWHKFDERGIDTATGRTSAASAMVLVQTLPS